MRIGIVIDELISGGFQKVALMEAKYFNQLGHEAVLVVLHRIEDEGYQDLIRGSGIQVERLSDRLPGYLKLNFHFPFFAFFSFFHVAYPLFIGKYIKKDKFDLLVVHGTYTAFSAIAIKKKLKVPLINFIHDSVTYIIENKYKNKFPKIIHGLLLGIAKKIDWKIIKNSDAVIAFPDMIQEMKKLCPNYSHYQEIFNGCEVIRESEIKIAKSDFAIAVTKWDQGKNFGFLLEVWKNLKTRIPLKVVGSFHPTSLIDETKELIKKARLDGIIEIVGSVSEKELLGYYQNAKFLVHPCREAFGMTILEASANGCPAIFTNNSGVSELYNADIRRSLPEENDLNGFVNLVTEFMQLDQEAYVEVMKRYYISAEKNSWSSHCEKIIMMVKF